MDKFKEVQDNEKDLLNSSLEEQTKAIQDMLNSAKNQYATTYDELEELAATYGFHLSEDLANPWKTAANAVDAYNKAVGNVTANGIPATGKVPGLNGGTNNVTYAENNPSAPDNNVKANQQANANKGLVSGGSGLLKSGSRGGAVTNLQNALNALGFNAGKADGIFGKNTKNALVAFQRASGVSADGILGPNTRKQFAARGYAKGTKLIPYTGIALTDEQGAGSEVISSQGVWRQVEHGDTVFNSEQVRMLYDMTSNPGSMLNKILGEDVKLGGDYTVQNVMTMQYDNLIHIDNIEGNFDKSLIPQMQKVVDASMNKWQRDMKGFARKLGH